MDIMIDTITDQCSLFAFIATIPKEIEEYITSEPSPGPGHNFACDILHRSKQPIFVIRDD